MTHVADRVKQTANRRRRPWKSSSPEARGRSARLLYGSGGEKGMQILKLTSRRVNTSNEGGNISSLLIFQRVRNWQKTVGWFGFLLRGTASRRFSFQERKRNEEAGGRKGTSPPSTCCSMKPRRPNVLTAFRRVNIWWNVRRVHVYFKRCHEGAKTHGTPRRCLLFANLFLLLFSHEYEAIVSHRWAPLIIWSWELVPFCSTAALLLLFVARWGDCVCFCMESSTVWDATKLCVIALIAGKVQKLSLYVYYSCWLGIIECTVGM